MKTRRRLGTALSLRMRTATIACFCQFIPSRHGETTCAFRDGGCAKPRCRTCSPVSPASCIDVTRTLPLKPMYFYIKFHLLHLTKGPFQSTLGLCCNSRDSGAVRRPIGSQVMRRDSRRRAPDAACRCDGSGLSVNDAAARSMTPSRWRPNRSATTASEKVAEIGRPFISLFKRSKIVQMRRREPYSS